MKRFLFVLLAILSISLGGVSVNAFAAVNLNTATQAELESVKGIGPAKAKAIMDYRAKTPFKNVNDLDNVKGFGPKSISKLGTEVTVSGSSMAAQPMKTDKMAAARAAKAQKAADKKMAADAKTAAPDAQMAAPSPKK